MSERDKEYYRLHKKQKSNYMRTYQKEHRDELNEYHRNYRKKHREKILGILRKYYRSHKDTFRKKQARRERNLGYLPLNNAFQNSVAHHINIDFIIYIPEYIHRKIPHNVFTGKNMDIINAIALRYIKDKSISSQIVMMKKTLNEQLKKICSSCGGEIICRRNDYFCADCGIVTYESIDNVPALINEMTGGNVEYKFGMKYFSDKSHPDNREARNREKRMSKMIERSRGLGTDTYGIETELRDDLEEAREIFGYKEPRMQHEFTSEEAKIAGRDTQFDSERGREAAEKRWKKWRKKNGKENDD